MSCDRNHVVILPLLRPRLLKTRRMDERLEINDSEEVASIYTPTTKHKGKRGIKGKEENFFLL